jgi:CubicO group peptidase (beta-lactamase class C family)
VALQRLGRHPGLIVERLSGMSLADFMKSRIFDPAEDDRHRLLPAGRPRTIAWPRSMSGDPKVQKLVPADNFMVLDITKPPVIASGGGGLVSTTADYARFAQMLLNGGELDGARILSPGTIALMGSNHLSDIMMAAPEARSRRPRARALAWTSWWSPTPPRPARCGRGDDTAGAARPAPGSGSTRRTTSSCWA